MYSSQDMYLSFILTIFHLILDGFEFLLLVDMLLRILSEKKLVVTALLVRIHDNLHYRKDLRVDSMYNGPTSSMLCCAPHSVCMCAFDVLYWFKRSVPALLMQI